MSKLICKLSLFIIFLTLICTNFSSTGSKNINSYSLNQNNTIFYVGGNGADNYSKIQQAIDNATENSIIYVYNKTYYENIVINESISLIGENKKTTIIDGQYKGNAITISSENVTISNFTIKNGQTDDQLGLFTAGISIRKSNNKVDNNIITNNTIGILGLRVTNLTICNNQLINDGVTFSPYENIGRPCIYKKYFFHKLKNNTVNSKPLLYYKNEKFLEISVIAGQIIAANCSYLTIKNQSFSDVDDSGIILAFCNNCIIENSTFTNNATPWIFRSHHNTFQYNKMSNGLHGICFDYGSEENIIQYNNFSKNRGAGVMLEFFSNNNLVQYNNFFYNSYDGFPQQSFKNKWKENYWAEWIGLNHNYFKFFPKILIGQLIEREIIPLVNFDWNPAKEPYVI